MEVRMEQGAIDGTKIPLQDKIGYGMGDLTYGIVFQMVGTYVVFFATAVLGISGSLVGLALSISVLWDAISDPLMGYLSDITRSVRFGRRHLYLLLGSAGMAVSNLMIWSIQPEWSNGLKVAGLFVGLMLMKTSATVFATPYAALGSELTTDYNERTSIQGIRSIFFLGGLMFSTVMGFLLFFNATPEFPIGQENPAAYRNMGLTVSLIALLGGFTVYGMTRQYIPHLRARNPDKAEITGLHKLAASFRLALQNNPYRHVVIAYLLTNISTALISSLGIHVFTYTFQLDNRDIGTIFGVLFGVSILSQPIWIRISRRIDKRPAILLGILFSLLGCVLVFFFVLFKDRIAGEMVYMLPFAALGGFGSGALFSMPYSMVADTIDFDEARTGKRLSGVYYGSMTFFYKFSQSLTVFLVGILLDVVRFDAKATVQPESTVTILGMTIAIGGFVVLVLAGVSYFQYGLNREKVAQIQEQIRRRAGGLDDVDGSGAADDVDGSGDAGDVDNPDTVADTGETSVEKA
jgi:glycoside/pentoside/hexuronide:cation symporter, GPH family